jgi:hypothetical protein
MVVLRWNQSSLIAVDFDNFGSKGRGGQQQRIAVGGAAGHDFRADHRAASRAIFHDHLLAPGVGDLLRNKAGNDVSTAACGERNDHAHRLRRIGLREHARRAQQHGSGE